MNYVPSDLKVVGTRPIRPDGVDKVTGRAQFGADMVMPGMLWGKVKRSPHAHARIVSIDASKALKLAGVKAVVTAADFPDIPSEEAFVGEGPMNFRDLSRNCMARDKALYEGHAVAAVAATSQAIADEALELIDVKYEVLPHVIDVEAAMADDAPMLHDDLFTAGVEPKPTKPSNIAKRVYFNKGDIDAGFKEAEVIVEGRYTTEPVHQAYIEPHACVCRYGADGQSTIFSSVAGPVHGARLCREAARHGHRQHPRHAGRDRRRLRRQDAGLSGAAGARAVEEVRPAGEDADDARRGVPRVRPDLRRRDRGEARREEGRHDRRGAARAEVPGRRVPRLADPARLHVRLRHVRHPERRGHRLRRGEQPPEGGGVSRTRRADLVLRGGKRDGRPGAQAGHGSDRAAREERCAQRHQDALRADAPEHRLPRDAGSGEVQRALEDAAEAGPGPRHRLRLLVQHRRRVLGGGARRRGRLGRRGVGQPRHRRLARLDRHDGGRGAGRSGGTGAHRSSATPARSASPMSPAAAASPSRPAWRRRRRPRRWWTSSSRARR